MSKIFKYHRSILKKVSFDAELFKKELIKAYRFLNPNERLELGKWVRSYIEDKTQLQSIELSDFGTITLG